MLQAAAKEGADGYLTASVMLSAATSSLNLQNFIESKLYSIRNNLLGAPVGKKVILFVDDINMPQKDKYGAQPPLELLRQCIDFGGFYDRKKASDRSIAIDFTTRNSRFVCGRLAHRVLWLVLSCLRCVLAALPQARAGRHLRCGVRPAGRRSQHGTRLHRLPSLRIVAVLCGCRALLLLA